MYANLRAHITIGDYSFKQVNEVEIERSIDMLADTAIVKMPTSFLLNNENGATLKQLDGSVATGDKVTIRLAYDGIIDKVEFVGYIKRIKPNIPMELECEDAIYLIRKKTINKLFVNAELRDVLAEIVKGTGIALSGDIPGLKLDKFLLKNANGAKALQAIKEQFGLSIYIDDNNELFAGLEGQQNIGNTVQYRFGNNVIFEDTELQYTTKDDVSLLIKATGIAPDNTRVEVQVGDDDGEVRTLHFYNIQSKTKLEEIATAKLSLLKYDGYKGTVTSFLYPAADRGWAADITDPNYPDRAGIYLVETVKTTFGASGARRAITLGRKI